MSIRHQAASFSALDIVLFVTIILIASSAQMFAFEHFNRSTELSDNINLKARAEITLEVLLRTTLGPEDLKELSYEIPGLKPISELLIESHYNRFIEPTSRQNPIGDLELKVYNLLANLSRPSYGFRFTAGLDDDSLVLTSLDNDGKYFDDINIVSVDRSHNAVIAESHFTLDFKLGLWRV